MNSDEANRQITQMIAFIRQEAKEKAEEIEVKTESAFMAKKLSLQTAASTQIREEFEKTQRDTLVQKKIERSKKISSARFDTMQARGDKVKGLKEEVLAALTGVESNEQYPYFIRLLIVQALIKMEEEHVLVQCRKCDEKIVQDQLEAAREQYIKAVKDATDVDVTVALKMDQRNFLPPAPSCNSQGASCRGGIVLTARNNKIVCRNTLDSRLDVVYSDRLPNIRGDLFGVRSGGHKNTSKSPNVAV